MKEQLPCGIVQDLMPLVIDEVAGEESKTAVEEHMKGCPDCSALFEQLRQADPAPAVDKHDEQHFKKAMQHTRRRGRVLKIAAIVMAAVILIGVVTVAANPRVLLNISSEVPVSWMQNAHLVRTEENIVMLQFTPSEKYRAFYGFDHSYGERHENDAVHGLHRQIWYDYPLLARVFDLDVEKFDGPYTQRREWERIVLPNGDWLVIPSLYYQEETGVPVSIQWHDATAEEILSLAEQGMELKGVTQIADIDPDLTYVSLTLMGPDGEIMVYQYGDEIPLLDAESQKVFTRMMEKHPNLFCVPGQVMTDLKG